jgi:hypothetical protein
MDGTLHSLTFVICQKFGGLGRFTTGKGGWVGLRTGQDGVERRKILTLPGLEFRPLGRPAP